MQGNKVRDILVGIAVLVIILLGIYLIRRNQTASFVSSPLPSPVSQFEQELQKNFNIVIPDNAVKADLKDVSGGNGMGLATYENQNAKFDYTVLANLEDPAKGYFYQAWLVRGNLGDSNYEAISLGILSLEKGGWLTNFQSAKDLSDHKKVLITLERINDLKPETHILEGSF